MKLYYESRGAGEPLVLIPGFAAGAWTWFEQIEELAKTFRVITFDPRGVSRSPLGENPAEAISLAANASDIADLLDFLEIEKANVLGVSFGGFVAQEFALKFPERLNKLVLACTSFGGKNHVAPDLEVLAAFVAAGDLNKSGARPALYDSGFHARICRRARRDNRKSLSFAHGKRRAGKSLFRADERRRHV